MTEEKQIEEMAKCCTYYHDGECLADALHPEKCDLMCEMFGVFTNLAKEDYRKQSEGEWIKHPCSYECTVCKEEFSVEGYAEDYDPITDYDLHYCPNCGAKMKGGAE